MERYEILDADGNVLLLRPPFIVDEVDGLGMPEVSHISQVLAQQDGEQYIQSWLRRRVVNIKLAIANACPAHVWDLREDLLRIMAQFADGFVLRTYMPNGARRDVLLRYMGGVTLPRARTMDSRMQPVVLQARTFDNPTLYDPTAVALFWTVEEEVGSWAFPLGFPRGFGSSVIDAPASILNAGSWKTYPIIRIGGPGEAIEIENVTTGDLIEFDPAYSIDAGEIITIDLTPGVKTVTHSVDGNIIDQITDDSSLGTFHIAAHPEAPGGVNVITVQVVDATAATWVQIEFLKRYIGV